MVVSDENAILSSLNKSGNLMVHITTESGVELQVWMDPGAQATFTEVRISVSLARLFQLLAPFPGKINASHTVLVPWTCCNNMPQTK